MDDSLMLRYDIVFQFQFYYFIFSCFYKFTQKQDPITQEYIIFYTV